MFSRVRRLMVSVAERKVRERADRERRIVEAARRIAEGEGWDAVTVRRLAEAIEHSQPVLYSHFANRTAIVAMVAIGGFSELADSLRAAALAAPNVRQARESVAEAYLSFARDQPRLYEAMFILPTGLRFAEADTRPELKAAFAALAAVVAPDALDSGAATETFWATLHGLAELERTGRIRPSAHRERVTLAVDALATVETGPPIRSPPSAGAGDIR